MADETKENVVEVEQDQASNLEKTEKTFTQTELDSIIQKEKAKAKRSAEKEYQSKMDEAEKMRKMNEQEKADYEAKKQADYIAELEAKINRTGLEKEASKMLSEAGIVSSEDVLDFVVGEDAEQTVSRVNAFTKLVKDIADKQVSEMLKGKTPTRTENQSKGLNKESFNQMSYQEKVDLYQKDPDLFTKLSS